MQVAELKNTQLVWREDGDPAGMPLVFANSLGTDYRLWDKLVPLLPEGLRIVRFDKRGHGLSSCPPGPYDMEEIAEDTAQLMDHLGITRAVFVGLSIGGLIGQRLAVTRPDLIRGLVLSNTAVKMGDAAMWQARIAAIEAGGIEAMVEPILERWFSAAFRETVELEAWRNMLARTPKAGYLGCCHAIAATDLTEGTKGLTLPTLVIAGSEDGASPPALVKATADLIAGASYHEIQGAGHLPCVEDPAAYAAILNGFLQEMRDV